MKLVEWTVLHDNQSYSDLDEFSIVEEMIIKAIKQNHHPADSGKFTLHPGKHKNGVVPIKAGFIKNLLTQDSKNWLLEEKVDRTIGACDAVYHFDSEVKPFIVEWETGNISSSHRAVNRMLKTILGGLASGGILILPTREMYVHLTDRIGNEQELKPYFDLWKQIQVPKDTPFYLAVVSIEHDELSTDVDFIPKGRDGNSLSRRQNVLQQTEELE